MNTKIIEIDINERVNEKITAKQGDTKSRFLLFHLIDNNKHLDLTEKSVRCYIEKPDGKNIFNDLIINEAKKGYCTLELTNQCLAVDGIANMELMVSKSYEKLTSIPFTVDIIKCINNEDAIVSTNEFSALMKGLSKIEEWDKEFADKSGKLEEKYTVRLNTLNAQLEDMDYINNTQQINILSIGGVPNNVNFDNGIIIQKAIDYLKKDGKDGGVVLIPNGKWYIHTPIDLKGGVTLQGVGVGKPDDFNSGTSLISNTGISIIKAKININEDDLYYRWSVGVKDLGLYSDGSISNSVGIELHSCAYTRIENVHLSYFDTGIKITYGMLDTYKDMALFACRNYGFHYHTENSGGISTSQLLNNIYIGQMTTGIPLKLEDESCIDITLERPSFETAPCAIVSSDKNCVFTMNDVYVENVPRTINNETKGTIFTIGNMTDGWKSSFVARGGIVLGNNTDDGWKNCDLFSFGRLNTVLVDGLNWNRVGKIMKINSIKPRTRPVFQHCQSETGLVITDLDNDIYRNEIIVKDCCVKSLEYGYVKKIPVMYFAGWKHHLDGYSGMNIVVDETNRTVSIFGQAEFEGVITSIDSKILSIPSEYAPKGQFFFSGVSSKDGYTNCVMRYVTSSRAFEIYSDIGGITSCGFSVIYTY